MLYNKDVKFLRFSPNFAVLAQDAIASAIQDYKVKQESKQKLKEQS